MPREIKNAIDRLKEISENWLMADGEPREFMLKLFTQEDMGSIDLAIQALEKKLNGDWISCRERLPENISTRVLVTLKSGMVLECFWINGTFKHTDGRKMEQFTLGNEPIAWQPLPEPYNNPELLKESE